MGQSGEIIQPCSSTWFCCAPQATARLALSPIAMVLWSQLIMPTRPPQLPILLPSLLMATVESTTWASVKLMLVLSATPTVLSSPTIPTCTVMLVTTVTTWASVRLRLMLVCCPITLSPTMPSTSPLSLIPMELLSLWSLLRLSPLEPTIWPPSMENERHLIVYCISGDGHLFNLKTIVKPNKNFKHQNIPHEI